MSTILYRPGDTHLINGIKCEVGFFEARDVRRNLRNGWTTDVNDLKEEKEEEEEEEKKEEKKSVRELFNQKKKVKK
jgi:hypothetical protein